MKSLAFFAVCLCLAAIAFAADSFGPKQSLLGQGKYIPDIGTFLNIGACSPAGASWDGKKIFFISSASGASQVYRLTDDAWPYQLTTFPDGIDGFNLSRNAELAIVSASVGGDENSQLYLMDTNTGRVHQLTNKPEVQYGSVIWARDDRSIYYRSNEENLKDFFIYQMDLTTGESQKIFDAVAGSNEIDDLSEDGKYLLTSNWSSNVNNDVYHLDLTTMKLDTVTSDTLDVLYTNLYLLPDNKTIWLLCNGNSDGMLRLAKMMLGSTKVEYVNDGWLDGRWEVEGLYFSRDFKYQGATTNEDGYSKIHLRDFNSKKELNTPPLDGIYGIGGSDSLGNFYLSFSSPTRAPDVWKWNPKTGNWGQLTHSIYAGIDRTLFREPKLIRYKSFDGLEIPAFLYLPADYVEGTPIPFVVDAHGGPESQFTPDFIRNFQYLMLNGYGVFAPNPRGSSGYGRDYLNLDNYKNRKNSLKDYKAGVDWLIANGYTQQGRIGIRGGSYGGYVVLGMITEYPDLFSAAIDEVGVANFVTFLQNTSAYRRANREAEYGPLTDPDFLNSISPIHKANLIKTPLLVVHGENDPRVPVGEARQILSAVAQNGTPVDSLIFPDEGHGASKRVNIIAEYRKQVEFLDRFFKLDAVEEKKE